MNDAPEIVERETGPSWARPNWPLAELDEINLGLDPTQATIEAFTKAATDKAVAAAPSADPEAIRRASEDSIRAMMLIRTYRVRGHLAAKLDPLGLHRSDLPADLTPEYHGFGPSDLDRPIWIGGALGFERATVREIVKVLQANYCGAVGLEYMHINDLAERRFLQERMEGKDAEIQFTPEGKRSILDEGHRGRAVGKVSCAQICRHEKIRARRRRERHSRRLRRSSNMAANMASPKSTSEWLTGAG